MEQLIKPSAPIELDRPTDLLDIIARVVNNPSIDVQKMEKLLDMQKQVVADQRKIAYAAAMSRLQAAIPQMTKYGQAKNSKFAKLEDIDVIVRPLIAHEGFSVDMDEESRTDKTVTFVMTFTHNEGHSGSKRLTVHLDQASMNREGKSIRPAIQDDGSTVSYARRYLLKMHLNIVEKGEDTDGEDRTKISDEQAKDLNAAIDEIEMDRGRFLVFMGVGEVADILASDFKKAVNAIDVKRRSK